MQMLSNDRTGRTSVFQADPFIEEDEAADLRQVSLNGLARLAIVAAGVGARFERDGIAHDPMAWMLAEREMFEGRCAFDAVLERRPFERALVLNAAGAGLGLDADPALLDELLEEDADCDDEPASSQESAARNQGAPRHDPPVPPRGRLVRRPSSQLSAAGPDGGRLFSSGFARYDGGGKVLVFVAAVVDAERTFRNRLFERFGAIAALGARVREGFDLYDEGARQLLSEHVADRLAVLAADPGRTTPEGFEVILEQRA